MTRSTMPRSFYSVAELAKLWDMDSNQIELLSVDGLQVISVTLGPEGGEFDVRGVAAEEVQRFEADHKAAEIPRELREDAKRGLRILVGLVGCYNQGEDFTKVTADQLLTYGGNLTEDGRLGNFKSDSWVQKELLAVRREMAAMGCEWFQDDWLKVV